MELDYYNVKHKVTDTYINDLDDFRSNIKSSTDSRHWVRVERLQKLNWECIDSHRWTTTLLDSSSSTQTTWVMPLWP